MKLVNAYNASKRRTGHHDPLLHASPSPPELAQQTGPGLPPRTAGVYLALCGTRVRVLTAVPWSPTGRSRYCSDCTTEAAAKAT